MWPGRNRLTEIGSVEESMRLSGKSVATRMGMIALKKRQMREEPILQKDVEIYVRHESGRAVDSAMNETDRLTASTWGGLRLEQRSCQDAVDRRWWARCPLIDSSKSSQPLAAVLGQKGGEEVNKGAGGILAYLRLTVPGLALLRPCSRSSFGRSEVRPDGQGLQQDDGKFRSQRRVQNQGKIGPCMGVVQTLPQPGSRCQLLLAFT